MVTTTQDPALPLASAGASDDDLLSGPAWSRHPTDVARLVVSTVALVASLLLCLRHPAEVRSVSVNVVELVSRLPAWLRTVLLGITQLYMVAATIVMAVVLARRPSRLFGIGILASAVAATAMAGIQSWVDNAVPNRVVQINLESSWIIGAAFPSGTYLAAFTAAAVVLGPSISGGWRRVITATIGVAVGLRIVTAVAVPLNLAVTVALGYAIGSAALALAGSPRRRASRRDVLGGLNAAGFAATQIAPVEVGAQHARTFLADDGSGTQAFVKLSGRDERDAYLIQRLLKTLRVKGLEDLRPAWTVGESTRHEALSGLLARSRGVHAPSVLAVGTTAGGDGLVAFSPVRGRRLGDVPEELVTDAVLDQVWAEVLVLRRQGIAHRWLTDAHLLVDIAGMTDELGWEPRRPDDPVGRAELAEVATPVAAVHVVDFRWAVHQAEPHQLAADVAMLTTSLALVVGAERSVAAAARALRPDELAEVLPLIQPLAMPGDVQRATSGQQHVLPAVRAGMQDAAGDVSYELLDLERIKLKQILGLAGGVLMAYTFLSFATSWSHISAALRSVSLWSVPELTVLAFLPYVLGSAVMVSVVARPLPFAGVVELMLGQSFLNRFTPANSGGMALRIRYLQKRGVDLGSAAASIALSSVASAIGQVVMLATFAVWAGSAAEGVGFRLPDASALAVGLVVVLTLTGVVWLTPWGRRVVARRVATTFRQVWNTLRELASSPSRFVTLFSFTVLGKFVTVLTFTECARAVGIGASFPKLGLLYLTASSVASAAPTPGGVGAVEAALAAALTGVGVPPGTALSAVFLFRLFSYWLPVPFGYLALRRVRETVLE